MDTARWQQVYDLFHAARELPPSARGPLLDATCGHDAALRAEVESLLREADDPEGPLAGPAQFNVRALLEEASWGTLAPGAEVGAYRIVRRLGSGGFGEVYLAESRHDSHRHVAIKLLRQDLAGQELARRRFELERRVLADLRHEHIVRLLDDGATDQGQPYLVMEYVDGVPIDDYCRANALGLDQRLALFERVCRAVAFAHQLGVVHRDLKPGNILVTSDGEPKLVDFGVVRLAGEGHWGVMTTLTRLGAAPFTPDYASPEQVRGAPVGLASDVYALGVVLYELLTERRPFALQGLSIVAAAQVIGEEIPAAPSVAASGDDADPPAAATGAGSPAPAVWAKQLRGDLDTIALVCLRKEPERRYRSAQELADELQRRGEGLPIAARGDSLAYRVRSAVRRHRLAAAVSGVLLVSLVAGGVVSSLGWARAENLLELYRQQLYLADMRVAFDAYERGEYAEVRRLLAEHRELPTGVGGSERRLLGRLANLGEPLQTLVGHDGRVNELTRLPNGGPLVSVGDDGAVCLWDVDTLELASKLETDGRPLHSVAVSPDGARLAAAGERLTVWNLADRSVSWTIPELPFNAESLAFSPDGEQLAMGLRYDRLEVLDADDGSRRSRQREGGRFERLAYLPQGDLLAPVFAAPGDLGKLARFDAALTSRRQVFSWNGTRTFQVLHGGRHAVLCGLYSPEFVLVQVATGNVLAKMPNRGAPIVSLAVSEDERLLATGHTDGRVRIYRLAPRALWDQFDGEAVAADAPLIESVACQVLVTNAQPAAWLQFLGNERLVVAGGGPQSLQVWKVEPRYGWQKTPTPLGECGQACVAPQGDRCFMRGDDLTLFVGDWPALTDVRPLEASLRDGNLLAISPDGSRGAFARHRTVVEVWDLERLRPLQVLPQMADMALAVSFSPCGRQVLSTNKVEGVMCWSMDDWSLVRRLPPEGVVTRMGFDPTGRRLWLSGSVDDAIYTQLLEWPSTSPLARWAEPSEVTAVAWSADGEWLACARSNGTIGLRRLSADENCELVGHTGRIGGVAFHPDGKTLYSIGSDSLRLWHVPTGKPLGVVEAPPTVNVDQLLFTPDGQTLRACITEADGDGGIWELPLPEVAW